MDEKLDTSWQCVLAAQTANCILGCIKGIMSSRAREVILLPPGVLGTSAQDRHGLEEGPEEGQKMVRRLGHFSCEDRLRELGLFSLKKRKCWGIPYCSI